MTSDSRKIALCVGQNEYDPATGVSPLRGCVNDALLIGEMLKLAGFTVRQVHNQAATQLDILERLNSEVAKLRAGDYFVLWNSSHGYQVQDRSGDELIDGMDEAICTYDTNPRDPLTDDKFAQILSRVHSQAFFFFGSDSCHSGTLTRAIGNDHNDQRKPKIWIPPDDIRFRAGETIVDLSDYVDGIARPKSGPNKLRKLGDMLNNTCIMNHVFLSGCKPDEYSWDAYIGNKFHGAMTYNFAMSVLKAWNEGKAITYAEAHGGAIAGLKDGNYDQSPQLEGPADMKNTPVFGYVP